MAIVNSITFDEVDKLSTSMNKLVFNGVDLRTLGVYVSGDGTYDSPKKEYKRVSVPGRSGDLYSFEGRYSNVTLNYTSILTEEFDSNSENLRSLLMSSDGYCRIEDGYHPNEYRMGVYNGPVDFNVFDLSAGKLTLSFDCQPQRWLKSGEVPTNPEKVVVGRTYPNFSKTTKSASSARIYELDDLIDGKTYSVTGNLSLAPSLASVQIQGTFVYNASGATDLPINSSTFVSRVYISNLSSGGHRLTAVFSTTGSTRVTGVSLDETFPITFTLDAGNENTFTVSNPTRFDSKPLIHVKGYGKVVFNITYADSKTSSITINIPSAKSGDYYIDCESMDCYTTTSGLDNNPNTYLTVDEFPVLKPGTNAISYTKTNADIEEITITPRWYIL